MRFKPHNIELLIWTRMQTCALENITLVIVERLTFFWHLSFRPNEEKYLTEERIWYFLEIFD